MSEEDRQNFNSASARVETLRGRLQGRQAAPVRLVETHVSWLLLADQEVFKLKKPLRLPFLDCSTLAARRQLCEEEVRLNRRLAASIYRGVVEVHANPDGVDFGGDGPVVDVAVRMRRFADGCLWSERLAAGTLDAAQVDAMARRLAAFHRRAELLPPASRFGSSEVIERITRNLLAAQTAAAADPAIDWPGLSGWLLDELAGLRDFLDQRRRQGRIRECHGDLHLANLLQEDGLQPTAFDAIEFDAELRNIDVVDDIAFVVMDLLANGGGELAWRFLDVYLETSGEHQGVTGLRFYMVRRALVRALVRELSDPIAPRPPGVCDAARYRRLAAELAAPAQPWLLLTHGLPASGKSRLAGELLQRSGAIRLRSDVERKRLFGLAALDSSRGATDADIYSEAVTRRTYRHLHQLCDLLLRAGWPVIVDAAFLRRDERCDFAALAASLGLRFAIVDCRAPPALLRERIAERLRRADDPSEADLSVLDRLAAVAEPLDAAELGYALVVEAGDPLAGRQAIDRWLANPNPNPNPELS